MNGKALLGLKRIAWAALLWALGNTLYVYLVLGGTRTFRVESAVFLLVAALLPLVWFAPSGSTPAVLTDKASRSLALVAGGLWLVALSPFVTLPFLSDDYVFLASYRSLPDVVNVGHFFRPMFAAAFLMLAKLGDGAPLPGEDVDERLVREDEEVLRRIRPEEGERLLERWVLHTDPPPVEEHRWRRGALDRDGVGGRRPARPRAGGEPRGEEKPGAARSPGHEPAREEKRGREERREAREKDVDVVGTGEAVAEPEEREETG